MIRNLYYKGFLRNYILFWKIIFRMGIIIATYAVIRNLDIIKIILIYLKDKLHGK
jgi:hypothetical protein